MMGYRLVRWIKKRKITVLVLIFTFIVSGLSVNLVQLFTLPLYWINKRLYRLLNAKIVYFHWCIIPWALESWAEYDIKVYGVTGEDFNNLIGRYANTEHALVIMNHHGDLDWMIGWVFINRCGLLGGTKAIMKDVAKYLPGIGWSFMFLEYPLLKRDWSKDKDRLAVMCKNLADNPVNMLLCLFAEGTRFTPEKHRQSMEYARKKGLPILRYHLFPRTKGFCFLMNNMEGTLGAVYDTTICYRGPKMPSIMGVVNAEPCAADICVRRFPISEIPRESDEELAQWLINLYKEKDELIEYHNLHKQFPGTLANIPKPPWTDLVVLMWICICSVPLIMCVLYLVWAGKWFIFGLIVLAVILADQLFQFIAKETQISRSSSSYGLQSANINGVVNHVNTSNSSNKDE